MQVQDTNSSSQTIAFDLIEQQTQDDVSSSSVSSFSPVEVKTNIVFNPLQHRTQGGSRDLSTSDIVRYMKNECYGDLPYTTSDTASSHNIDHQNCVNDLLFALQPISNSVNRFVNKYYEHYYTKLSKLTMGPFVPRTFGIFPTIAINFNVISNYHWDSNDDPNGFCFLVALGDFEGGELCFPQLQILEESSENSTDKRRYKDDLIKGRRVIHAVLIKEY
ncbi:hypothetical protein GLOIN_2v1721053 [Rhizophagus irregularis DAOM 181602=DAOM 197198]|nr:hypothetical protein GLOIN_2v1721053 [Rhizophagus irregularis DAOM 181602=DAOM 197198]